MPSIVETLALVMLYQIHTCFWSKEAHLGGVMLSSKVVGTSLPESNILTLRLRPVNRSNPPRLGLKLADSDGNHMGSWKGFCNRHWQL